MTLGPQAGWAAEAAFEEIESTGTLTGRFVLTKGLGFDRQMGDILLSGTAMAARNQMQQEMLAAQQDLLQQVAAAAENATALSTLVQGAGLGGGITVDATESITLQTGVPKETAKDIVKAIKQAKMKVQAQIQEDQVRVSGKKRDDLQQVIAMVKGGDFNYDFRFINFRD